MRGLPRCAMQAVGLGMRPLSVSRAGGATPMRVWQPAGRIDTCAQSEALVTDALIWTGNGGARARKLQAQSRIDQVGGTLRMDR
eukprot:2828188-Prymnesium_polylepis.1